MDNDNHTDHFRRYQNILRNVTMIGQLGLSLIMPVLLCMLACWYLTAHFHAGGWVYIPGLILGLGASCMTAWKTYRMILSKDKDRQNSGEDRGPSFNRHM